MRRRRVTLNTTVWSMHSRQIAVANVETTLLQGSSVAIDDKGKGFETIHGVAVGVFCGCRETGGKLKAMFLNPGNPGLISISNSLITFTLPPTTPTGPGSIIVSLKATRKLQRQEQRGVGAARSADKRDRRFFSNLAIFLPPIFLSFPDHSCYSLNYFSDNSVLFETSF